MLNEDLQISDGKITDYHECCLTEAEKDKYKYKWIIRDFNLMFTKMGEVKSSPFEIKGYPMKGGILITKGETTSSQDGEISIGVEITVNLKSDSMIPHMIDIEGSVLDTRGKKQLSFGNTVNNITQGNIIGLEKVLNLADVLYLMDRLENDTVTMFFDFTIMTNSTSRSDKYQLPMPENTLADNFRTLFKDPIYSDVTITVGRKKFQVHKIVLAARSSVFAAMFEQKMKENESNNIDITDMSGEVVEEMLKFIYTDKTERLEDMTSELLDAAEKYDLGTLKNWCGQCLQKNLKCFNAAESLVLADRYNLKETKTEILKFISSYASEVRFTEGYKTMREKHLHLIVETCEFLLYEYKCEDDDFSFI